MQNCPLFNTLLEILIYFNFTPSFNISYQKYSMGITEAIQSFFGRSDSSPISNHEKIQKMIKEIENRKSQTQLKLAQEKEKAEPDILKVDRLEREARMWGEQQRRLEARLKDI